MLALATAIDHLRAELAEAAARAATQPSHGVLLSVDTIEVELGVEIEDRVEGSAGINVWVITIGASKSASAVTRHTVTLSLKAHDAQGQPLRVAAQGPGLPTPPGEGG